MNSLLIFKWNQHPSLWKQPSFFAPHPSGVSREGPLWFTAENSILSAFSKTRLPPELRRVLSCESPAVFLHFPLEEKGPWGLVYQLRRVQAKGKHLLQILLIALHTDDVRVNFVILHKLSFAVLSIETRHFTILHYTPQEVCVKPQMSCVLTYVWVVLAWHCLTAWSALHKHEWSDKEVE